MDVNITLCFCFLVPAPTAPVLTLTPLSPDSMQIVWMKGHVEDIVKNVTLEYMYIGPCNCSDKAYLCQRKALVQDQLLANSIINVSNLEQYSEYSFEIMVSNTAGSSSTVVNKRTLASSKLSMLINALILILNH